MNAPTDDHLLEQLHTLMHAFKSQMHHAARAGGQGLAPMEARALNFFARTPGATASDLVNHSGRDKAQVTRLVKTLLEHGLVAAAADPADRRCVRITPTDAGRAMQRTMLQQRKRWAAQLVKDFDAADRADLADLLGRMLGNIRLQTDPAAPEQSPER